MIIAIDGPSASGKGTLARRLAKHFNLPHLDTGALYRAVAVAALRAGKSVDHPEEAIKIAAGFSRGISAELMNDPELRLESTSISAGKVAAIPEVREHLLNYQKQFARQPGGAVLDGRDIGTVIAPEAEIKLFIVASAEKRAERRVKELQSRGQPVTYDHVLKDMQERDARDATRSVAPTKAAPDAVLLDTSNLDADAVFAAALQIVKQKTA